jgi:uncharacterized membrane protein (DUF2068 family)
MLGVGLGLFQFVDHNQGRDWQHLIRMLQLDAHSRWFHAAVERLAGIDRAHLRLIEAGTFFYAVIHVIEGTGLLLERDWAGYIVVGVTSSLLPFELYEFAQRPSLIRAGVLLVNAAILAYLIAVLIRERRFRVKNTDPAPPHAPSTSL